MDGIQRVNQVAYNEIVMTGFNLAITAVPPFFLAIFERDLDESVIRDVRPICSPRTAGCVFESDLMTNP